MNDVRGRVVSCSLALAALTAAGSAIAAGTDGRLGASSSATVRISVSVAARGGFVAGSEEGAAALSSGQPACLWLNTATAAYSILLNDGSGATQVRWRAGPDTVALQPGVRSAALRAAARPKCNGAERAALEVAGGDRPSGTNPLLLLIAPE